MDNVWCIGHESSITYCAHNGWAVHNCDRVNEVAVSCGTSPVQHGRLRLISNHTIAYTSIVLRNTVVRATIKVNGKRQMPGRPKPI